MMFPFMFYPQHSEHVHHSVDPFLHLYYLEEVSLNINISAEIFFNLDVFVLCFQTQTSVQVPIAAGNEDEVITLQHWKGPYPCVELFQGLSKRLPSFNHVLGDTSELCAETA